MRLILKHVRAANTACCIADVKDFFLGEVSLHGAVNILL
jgi:hypothetical protein